MSVPVLTPRAAREQATFRQLLDAMARPGTIAQAGAHGHASGANAYVVTVLEALLDHEVAFATAPGNPELEESVLRVTASHLAPLEAADFIVADGAGAEAALRAAKEGDPEYPDRNATVVLLVDAIGQGEEMVLEGPGINGTRAVRVAGFAPGIRALRDERNAELPLGIDLVLLARDGQLTCIPRYTRVRGEEE